MVGARCAGSGYFLRPDGCGFESRHRLRVGVAQMAEHPDVPVADSDLGHPPSAAPLPPKGIRGEFTMARFNTKTAKAQPTSRVTSTGRVLRTYEGGRGRERDARSELFLLSVANFVSQQTFYEPGAARDDRFATLVRELALTDPSWTAGLLGRLRGEGNLRTARSSAPPSTSRHASTRVPPTVRPTGRSSPPSSSGPTSPVSCSRTGRRRTGVPCPSRSSGDRRRRTAALPRQVAAKYDTASKGYRFGDILNLVHAAPDPEKPWQGELFEYALDRRHNLDTAVPPGLEPRPDRAPRADGAARRPAASGRHGARRCRAARGGGHHVGDAGRLAPGADGQGGLGGRDSVHGCHGARPKPAQLRRGRCLRRGRGAGGGPDQRPGPGGALAAVPLPLPRRVPARAVAALVVPRWSRLLGHPPANVPALPGRTLVLVDRLAHVLLADVGPLGAQPGRRGGDLGTAPALRAADADLRSSVRRATARYRGRVGAKILSASGDLGGTDTTDAVRRHYRKHDRVLIVTDEQYAYNRHGDPTEQVPEHVPA